jgi:hypothetical protein
MPDQSSAANEHALIQEITAPLATIPDDPVQRVADVDFPIVLRGYDRLAVDAYVKQTSQLVAELQATRSPEAAVRRALERVGEQISGILQRAHDTAGQITTQSRAEAEDRLELARAEAAEIVSAAQLRVRELDADTDRIWAERHRIVDDAQDLARQLLGIAEASAERLPAAEEGAQASAAERTPPQLDKEPLLSGDEPEERVEDVVEPARDVVDSEPDVVDPERDVVDPEDATAVLPPVREEAPEPRDPDA